MCLNGVAWALSFLSDSYNTRRIGTVQVTDALTKHLDGVDPGDKLFDELFPLVISNLPKKLQEVAGDRVASRFPVQYQRNSMASTLASRLVYSEGIHFVETQPEDRIAKRFVFVDFHSPYPLT